MEITKIIVLLALAATCALADAAGISAWTEARAQSRPAFPHGYEPSRRTLSSAGGESAATREAEIALAEKLLPRPGSGWTWREVVGTADERLAEARGTLDGGETWTFAVYTQLGNSVPYYWTATGCEAHAGADALGEVIRRTRETICAKTPDSAILVCTNILTKADEITTALWGRPVDVPFERAWLAFADDRPGANWEHPCRYVFFNETLTEFIVTYQTEAPAIRRAGTGESVYLTATKKQEDAEAAPTLEQVRQRVYAEANAMEANASSLTYAGDVTKSHYVLISGGANPSSNGIRFWADTAMMYSTLTKKYGVPKEQIHVYVSDGTDPAADANLADTSSGVTPVLVSSPTDLDGDGSADVDGAATKSNVSAIFSTLRAKLTANEQLFVFVTSHGSADGTAGEGNRNCLGWLYSTSGSAYFRDDELHDWTKGFSCPVAFAIETCYSGGFVDDIVQTANRVIATACNHYENSWGYGGGGAWGTGGAGQTYACNCWAYPFNSAVRGYRPRSYQYSNAYPWQDGSACLADSNRDGAVSFAEAKDYALANDLAGQDEHPQYGESASGLGTTFFFVKQAGDNDNFANAEELFRNKGTTRVSNAKATTQTGEPLLKYSSKIKATVWWKWTAPWSGNARFDTVGTTFDTALGVYTGASLSALAKVEEDDDSGKVFGGASTSSACLFACTGGTTYYICVGGKGRNWYSTETGTIVLNWELPAVLSSIEIVGATAFVGTSETYSCLANMSDGTSETVTPEWSIAEGPADAAISSAGVLTLGRHMGRQDVTLKTRHGAKTATLRVSAYSDAPSALADAVDAPELAFTTGGDAEWLIQSAFTDDGTDAARSGTITHGQSTWMQTTVEGPGSISFRWHASSEGVSFDCLEFLVDGKRVSRIGGTDGAWATYAYEVAAGTHALRWNYRKDGSVSAGEDAGFVDQVKWKRAAVVASLAELREAFPSGSEVVTHVTDGEGLAAFSAFLGTCGVTSLSALTTAQKNWAYRSFKIAEIATTPELYAEEPKLVIDELKPTTGNWSVTVSLTVGAKGVSMVRERLRERIRVGTEVDAIDQTPTVLISPESDGSSLTFTVAPPGARRGFMRVRLD